MTLGHGSRLVLVHGFTQTGRSWDQVASKLSSQHEIVLVDLPGHGGSSAVRADLVTGAALIAQAGGKAAYAGYSLGGRHCLHLALLYPDLVERLVLISASPGIAENAERAARRATDDALAASLDVGDLQEGARCQRETSNVEHGRCPKLEAFLRTWLDQPLFSKLDHTTSGFETRLAENSCAGLASSLRLAGAGVQESLWKRLGELDMPVLAIAGSEDRKYASIARRMVREIGTNAQVAIVERAGHAAHLERPDALASILDSFMNNR